MAAGESGSGGFREARRESALLGGKGGWGGGRLSRPARSGRALLGSTLLPSPQARGGARPVDRGPAAAVTTCPAGDARSAGAEGGVGVGGNASPGRPGGVGWGKRPGPALMREVECV